MAARMLWQMVDMQGRVHKQLEGRTLVSIDAFDLHQGLRKTGERLVSSVECGKRRVRRGAGQLQQLLSCQLYRGIWLEGVCTADTGKHTEGQT